MPNNSDKAENNKNNDKPEHQSNYEKIFHNLPLIAFTLDRKGRLIDANKAAMEYTGYNKKDFLGAHFGRFGILAKADTLKAGREFLKNLHGEVTKKTVYNIKRQDGIWREVELMGIPLIENGKVCAVLDIGTDITEEKKIRRNVLKEKERAGTYLDIAGVMIVAIDLDQKITMVNKKCCEVLGFAKDEILKKNWFDNFIPEKNRDDVKKVFDKVIKGKDKLAETNENWVLTKSGQTRLIAWRNTALKDDEGKIIGTLSSGENITEKKQAEEKLKESEEKFRILMDQAPEALFLHDLGGQIVDVNRTTITRYGYTREELLGLRAFDIDPDYKDREDQGLFWENLKKQRQMKFEARHKDKAGNIFPVEISLSAIMIKNQQFILALASDLTEKKQAELEIQKSMREWSETFDSMAAGVSIHSPEHKILNVNRTIVELLGKKAEDLIGQPCFKIFHQKDFPLKACPLVASLKTKKQESIEYFEPTLGKWLAVSANPVRDKSGKIEKIIHVLRDITERKVAEEELKKRNVELEKANKLMVGREMRMIELKKKIKELGGSPSHKATEVK